MDSRILLWLSTALITAYLVGIHAVYEDIPFQYGENLCVNCFCGIIKEADDRHHYMLSCILKNFHHILAYWPDEFEKYNNNGTDIVVNFSGNPIHLLQQLPASNASLDFSCRHCGIWNIQTSAFKNVPNLKRLDLSWNEIRADVLTPEVLSGSFKFTGYDSIGLSELLLSHNKLHTLNKSLFKYVPNLTKLDLSNNEFNNLDSETTMAINGAVTLEVLILSRIGINSLPENIFQNLANLNHLDLSGNELKRVPDNLKYISYSLKYLSLAGNQLNCLTEMRSLDLKSLRHLNISYNNGLKNIENSTFLNLGKLEYLDCSHNRDLLAFNMDNLIYSHNLKQLDVSYSGIQSLSMSVQLPVPAIEKYNKERLEFPWPSLRIVKIIGNPWQCDCNLLLLLEAIGAHREEGRCDSPYTLAGSHISNLTSDFLCQLRISKLYQNVQDDPPRFLRKRYITLTALTSLVIVLLGLIIGFLIVCIRKRLKSYNPNLEHVRYSSVCNSNL